MQGTNQSRARARGRRAIRFDVLKEEKSKEKGISLQTPIWTPLSFQEITDITKTFSKRHFM